jgi:heterodisulfide reductase subunit A
MDLVRMAVAKSRLQEPLRRSTLGVFHSAVVIGGGLTGMTAALDIAAQDLPVHIIERSGTLGGNLRSIRSDEDGRPISQLLDGLIDKVNLNERITVHLSTEVKEVSGFVGNFGVRTSQGDEIKAGAIIVAVGGREYEPRQGEFGYGDPRVITQWQLEERMLTSPMPAQNVVMIQCVGSRTTETPYCSRVCCTEAVRNAIRIKRATPATEVYLLHKDIRTYGFREDYYKEAGMLGVKFIRFAEGKDPRVERNGAELRVLVNDVMLGDTLSLRADLVVLSTGIRPNADNGELSKLLKVPLSKDGFFLEAHMKLRPVDFATEGIFLAGLAHWPKFAEESIAQATGAAARAMTIISKEELEGTAFVPVVDEARCRACGTCEEVCAFKAVSMREVSPGIMKASVNPVMCKGCGGCAAVCPTGAISSTHFTDKQLLAAAKSALKEASQ